MHGNLVLAIVGDSSIHEKWLGPDQRFDLLIGYFGDVEGRFREQCKYYTNVKGHKWANIHSILRTHRSVIDRYERIWCPDEDVLIDTRDINTFFDLCKDYDLNLAQPSLNLLNSSHWITQPEPGSLLRYTNFVEIMAPLFSHKTLLQLSETFTESVSGWGLDWIWPKLLNYQGVAIIDAVTMTHTRPVGQGATYRDLESKSVIPWQELDRLTRKYGVTTEFVIFRTILK